MTPPLPPEALQRLLETLSPEPLDPFPHLENLSPDKLLQRRVEISGQLKILEQERQVIDAELLEIYSDAELRHGVRVAGGWVLKQRTRTSWDYAPAIRDAIKDLQRQAQRDGQAEALVSAYLCLTQES